MTDILIANTMDELDDVLEAERAALLTGDLEQIGRLLERKESLMDDIARFDNLEAASLEKVTLKLKRNQDLLDNALEGIRTVARRLASLRRVKKTLDTYDANGAKRTIDMNSEGSVEKRA